MRHIKEQSLLELLTKSANIKAISIITSPENFEKKFDGNISFFFKSLKNGLNSIHGISNRKYFKNLSGCYFSLFATGQLEIIILYDASINKLNNLQVATRIKKLLGLNTQIDFGEYSDYTERIKNMTSIDRRTQTFGEFYFKKKLTTN